MDVVGAVKFLNYKGVNNTVTQTIYGTTSPRGICLTGRATTGTRTLTTRLNYGAAAGTRITNHSSLVFLTIGPRVVRTLLTPLGFALGRQPDHFVLYDVTTKLSVTHVRRVTKRSCPIVHVVPGAPTSIKTNVVRCYSTGIATRRRRRFLGLVTPTKQLSTIPRTLVSTTDDISNYNPT